jgi:hypothetical protein
VDLGLFNTDQTFQQSILTLHYMKSVTMTEVCGVQYTRCEYIFLSFVNIAASDLHALQAALLLPPEHTSEVRRLAISRTPIPALLGGLLSEND